MAFTEDLSVFFNTDEFADQATVGGVAVRVIFEQAFADPFGPALDTAQPQCWAPSASVQHAVQGTVLVVKGVSYTVERVEPDGTGVSRLIIYPQA